MAQFPVSVMCSSRSRFFLCVLVLMTGVPLSGCQSSSARSRSGRPVLAAGFSRPAPAAHHSAIEAPEFDEPATPAESAPESTVPYEEPSEPTQSDTAPAPPVSSSTPPAQPPVTPDPAAEPAADPDESTVAREETLRTDIESWGGSFVTNEHGQVIAVDVSFAEIPQAQLLRLTQFTILRELDLSGTSIQDDGLQAIARLSELRSLKLKGTKISDAGFRHLAELSSLQLLDASRTSITDDALSAAAAWTQMTYLSLNNTAITDEGLRHLFSLKTLKGLNVMRTSVSAEGVAALQEALPGCLVISQIPDEAEPLLREKQADGTRPVQTSQYRRSSGAQRVRETQLAQMVELAAQQPQLATHLAKIYSDRGQWAEAAQILKSASETDDQDPELSFRLGEALAHNGLTSDAVACFQRSVGDAAAHYNVGLIAWEKILQDCEQSFEQSLAADPDLDVARTRLTDVRRELAVIRSISQRHTEADAPAEPPQVIPGNHSYRAEMVYRNGMNAPGSMARQASIPGWLQTQPVAPAAEQPAAPIGY